ncbi:MAG TPA: DUF2071 domain-containing protein [Cyclobacteriaceae bacterium]|nr:DUF2071 domain-containing protein [Cyclobacteriaceae bacterium]
MPRPFLTAEWRKLAIANYVIDPVVLLPYVPVKTEIDFRNKQCYLSLVGFMFFNTRVKGVKIPFHVDFEQINLRFYVRCGEKRGVVFIKEIVAKPTVAWMANLMYKESYRIMQTAYSHIASPGNWNIEYRWKGKEWNTFRVASDKTPLAIKNGSEEEFILEHYWGYKKNNKTTMEYLVEHPSWEVYPVTSCSVNVDFGDVYGQQFAFLSNEKPVSVFLAEGSEVAVHNGRFI